MNELLLTELAECLFEIQQCYQKTTQSVHCLYTAHGTSTKYLLRRRRVFIWPKREIATAHVTGIKHFVSFESNLLIML